MRPFLCLSQDNKVRKTAMFRNLIIVGLAILLIGCGGGDNMAVGGVSQSEADALNNAAEMLDQPATAGPLTAPPRTTPKRTNEK